MTKMYELSLFKRPRPRSWCSGVFKKDKKEDSGMKTPETGKGRLLEGNLLSGPAVMDLKNLQKFPKLFHSQLVEVRTGSDPDAFLNVPKYALIEHSEYFKSLFAFQEKQGRDHQGATSPRTSLRPIVLESHIDHAPEVFDRFIQFTFCGHYSGPDGELTPALGSEQLFIHAQVYSMADRLQAIPLKEHALRSATRVAVIYSEAVRDVKGQDRSENVSELRLSKIGDVIREIYSHTSLSDDPFRMLVAALSAACIARLRVVESFNDCFRSIPEFSADVLAKVSRGQPLVLDVDGSRLREVDNNFS